MNSNHIIIILGVLLIISIIIILFKRQNESTFERKNFPFRAIWKEMPESEKNSYRQHLNNAQPNLPVYNEPIGEIYPIGYTSGNTIDRMYNVRPSTYGALTMRDTERPYQDITTEFIRIGTVSSVDKLEDTVMTLFRRDIAPQRDMYEYKVIDKTNGNNVEIFLSTNTTLLRNGDKINIPGYESKGLFEVSLDTRYRYSYLKPF